MPVNVIIDALLAPQPGEPYLEVNDLIQPQNLDLDLNEPLDEDLRGIDELLEAADNLEAEPIQPNQPQEKIIDEGFFLR